MKKYSIVAIFLIIVLMSSVVFASSSAIFEVVEKNVCKIELDENSTFTKELVKEDISNREVTIQLNINNGSTTLQPTGELMLVIDNSESMNDPASSGTSTRKDLVFSSAQKFVDTLLKDNTKLKVGIVSFSTASSTSEATADDAKLVSELSNDATALKNAIANIQATGPRTNLESGLTLASTKFSGEDVNRYMVVLTDGVPNVAIGSNDYYSDTVITKTKTAITSLESKNIQLITMLTGIDNETDVPANLVNTTQKTFKAIIEEVFGTESNPTYGKFYYIQDNEIEKTITEDIYNDLKPVSQSLKNIKIVDFFPKEIIDNFNFSYVSSPNVGKVTAEVDKETNSITWTIDELKSGETGTVQYKLKLKDNYSSSILGKILDTNEKVDISYTDVNGKDQTKTSDVTPKVRVTEPPAVIPAAGTPVVIALATLSVALVALFGSKLFIINKEIK